MGRLHILEEKIKNNLSTGSFIGDTACLNDMVSTGTYRSVSHVQVLQLSKKIYQTFLQSHEMQQQVVSMQSNIDFLRKTSLFGEGLSYLVQNKIVQSMQMHRFDQGQLLLLKKADGLYLLHQGELLLQNTAGQILETLQPGNFCGEQGFLAEKPLEITVQSSQDSTAYFIGNDTLSGIPIVHWKLLEISAKRKNELELLT